MSQRRAPAAGVPSEIRMPPQDSYFYDLLDLPFTATEADVKRAYRQASLRWHPDKNPGNKQEAEEMFKLLARAYEVLKDPELRKLYDAHGEEGLKQGGPPDRTQQPFGGAFMSTPHPFQFRSAFDVFNDFFGGHNPFDDPFFRQPDPFAHDPFFAAHQAHFAHADPFRMFGNTPLVFQSFPSSQQTLQRSQTAHGNALMQHGGDESQMRALSHAQTMPTFATMSPWPSMFPTFPVNMHGFSSSSSASSFSFNGGVQSRTSTRIVNGQRMTETVTVDANGNETRHILHPDGSEQVFFNGQQQQ